MNSYRCIGGPLDGQFIAPRFTRGFLLVDKPNGLAWVYDASFGRMAEPIWEARSNSGEPLDRERRIRAADSREWDVIAL